MICNGHETDHLKRAKTTAMMCNARVQKRGFDIILNMSKQCRARFARSTIRGTQEAFAMNIFFKQTTLHQG